MVVWHVADASSQMQFAAGIGRGLHSDHATAAKALVSAFEGLIRHDYVFRSVLVFTDALAGHADDLVEQLTCPPRRAGCAHSGGAGPCRSIRRARPLPQRLRW
jgi:hypothetical protein